jgi:N-acetylmuramoyl-L-alanine amidase
MVAFALAAALAAVSSGGVAGQVTEGPTCPVQHAGETCTRPYAAHVTAASGGSEVAATDAGADGSYRLELAPGDYTVCARPPTPSTFPREACRDAHVDAGRDTRVDLELDTGIRGASGGGGGGGSGPARPHIVQSPIPFPAQRKREMRAYAQRHYGLNRYTLVDPHVIVEHVTAINSYSATWKTFASDAPDPELHERPGTCSHFVIDRDGTIHELVPLGLMCRHTVGLNWTAFGIEHVGLSDAQVMGDARQLDASLRLTCWLKARYRIALRNVIGHNESLSSPYHHERVARLRHQTHADMQHATMTRYRALLRRRCP